MPVSTLAERLGSKKVDELISKVPKIPEPIDARYTTPSTTFRDNLFSRNQKPKIEMKKMTTYDKWNPSLDMILVEAMERNDFRNKRLTPDDRKTLLKALAYEVSETGLIYKLGTLRRNGFRNYKSILANLVAGGAMKLDEIGGDFAPIHKGRPKKVADKVTPSLKHLVDRAKAKAEGVKTKSKIKLKPERKTEVEAKVEAGAETELEHELGLSEVESPPTKLSPVIEDITQSITEDVVSSKNGVISVKSLPYEVEITIRIKPSK